MFGLFKIDPIRFWIWFFKRETYFFEIFNAMGNKKFVLKKIARKIKKIDSGLTFEIEEGVTTNRLYISAGGDRDLFPIVKEIVSKSPKELTKWKVIAFKQRKPSFEEVFISKTPYNLNTVFYSFLPQEEGSLNIAFYYEGYHPSRQITFYELSFIILDSLIGEVDAVIHISQIALLPISEKTESAKPVANLVKEFDFYLKNRNEKEKKSKK